MKWSDAAQEAIAKVPFFVRRKVKKKVEEEAVKSGASIVTMEHVKSSREKFLNNMDDMVKGYELEVCFGSGDCPNKAADSSLLFSKLEELLESYNLRDLLKERVKGPLKLHHNFRVTIADCPNACSRPQIVDIGIIGASLPSIDNQECSSCGECIGTCKENAISTDEQGRILSIEEDKCVKCGQCAKVCPTKAIFEDTTGYRILVGGKLGRRPRLGRELPGIFDLDNTLSIVKNCLDLYVAENVNGERFGSILERKGLYALLEEIIPSKRKQ